MCVLRLSQCIDGTYNIESWSKLLLTLDGALVANGIVCTSEKWRIKTYATCNGGRRVERMVAREHRSITEQFYSGTLIIIYSISQICTSFFPLVRYVHILRATRTRFSKYFNVLLFISFSFWLIFDNRSATG